jgi:hypothetical protein
MHLGLPSGLYPSSILTKTVISLLHAICLTYHIADLSNIKIYNLFIYLEYYTSSVTERKYVYGYVYV